MGALPSAGSLQLMLRFALFTATSAAFVSTNAAARVALRPSPPHLAIFHTCVPKGTTHALSGIHTIVQHQRRHNQLVLMSDSENAKESPAVATLRARLWSWGWISWWSQTILSVIAAVILIFANTVSQIPASAPVIGGRVLAVSALGASAVSNFWTWSYTRISARFGRKMPTPADASSRATGALAVGIAINLVGIALSILGAEAIVGILAAKTLTQSGVALAGAAAPVQAIDMLIVQANTNTMASHFISLCAAMRMQKAASTCATSKS
uniref:Uncharacterized protein n=1 Tax=Chrysotila carterae TaxID=13221 RepID=A0A7S4C3B6_CHRCT|mmetsp:Transcript_1738/g.3644  ORF Transcript_1738/g.3644 Transcript_1738/m.3644 type:complete len:268 (+) Transcript_1738:95-898(+)